MAARTIYKLLTRTEWENAWAQGVYRGSAQDGRDGFIHFSMAAQLAETARKHFSGVPDLVLLAVDVEALQSPPSPQPSPQGEREKELRPSPQLEGEFKRPLSPCGEARRNSLSPWGEGWGEGVHPLRWEPSRGGDLFPHLYADLHVALVTSAVAVPLAEDGTPIIPEGLAP